MKSLVDIRKDGVSAFAQGNVPVPDEIDESDPVYFYFGWESFNGGDWLIQRQLRETGAAQSAAPVAADFAAAWAARETLGYS